MKTYFALLPQRERAAFLAIADRRAALNFAALACPPFRPPSFPNATAAGFFSVVTSPRMRDAMRFGSILERLGIGKNLAGQSTSCQTPRNTRRGSDPRRG